ncbi:rod shape-determining protein MreC [Candidatus Thiosymbion oneisti]|uniref:rod shape-determining protein MreC n=1 Tax=Candidatus Thiosymbion oneisti TaxID=589554 RepID=UPI00105BCBAC|nr:rod shape-determining protein MreC [Candidatus Thiosymbion oneisti]
MNPLFVRGPSPSFRILLATVLAIGLVVADHRYQSLDPLRSTLSVIVYPVHYLTGLPGILAREVQDYLARKEALRHRNRSLYRDNLVLKARLQRFEALEAENIRLRALLGSSLRMGDRVLIAELMAVDLDPYRQQVMIDRGASSGVFVGQPVLDANAVMGQVTRVDSFSATVLLITDAGHGLPVQINRNGLRTIARGTGFINRLELSHLPKNADVRVGDLVVTSGLGGHFPPGYPVAQVIQVRQESGKPFATVIAEPTARLDRSREVLLVWTLAPALLDRALTRDTGEEVWKAP